MYDHLAVDFVHCISLSWIGVLGRTMMMNDKVKYYIKYESCF